MVKILLILLVASLATIALSKHLHPRSIIQNEEDTMDTKAIASDIDGMSIEVIRHIKPSRFVPVNNVIFFQRYPPCEEGFERDLFGVCREVWE